MCSVLIFAKHENLALNLPRPWQRPQRGDVIDIHEDDNFNWGDDIQGPNPLGWWRVVVLPGVAKSNVDGLLTADPVPENPDEPYRNRIKTIDINLLDVNNGIVHTRTRKQLLDAMSTKPKPQGSIIGESNTIG